ncbi:MAG: hypothetical protein JWL62_344 [Hyphomicrobiales bacterium]|nr:hypothetical protein [Hyphomicrobiales bacterium]
MSITRTAAATALLLFSAGAAFAHVTLEKPEATSGASYKAVLRIGHGCGASATTGLSVEIPEGLVAVKPMPKPGWQLTTQIGPYATPVTVYGQKLESGTRNISWTGGKVQDSEYDEFVFVGQLGDVKPGTTLYLPVLQTCETGENRWVEIPKDGQTMRDLKFPAPTLKVSAPPAKAQANVAITLGPIRIEKAWARATPGGSTIGGAYLKVTNTGAVADKLVSGETGISDRFELHDMSMTDGVMQMRPVADGITLAPGQIVELRPGGLHVMLVGLKQPLKAGENFSAVLKFEKAGTISVPFAVQPIGAGAPMTMGSDMPEMDHSQHMQQMMVAPAVK